MSGRSGKTGDRHISISAWKFIRYQLAGSRPCIALVKNQLLCVLTQAGLLGSYRDVSTAWGLQVDGQGSASACMMTTRRRPRSRLASSQATSIRCSAVLPSSRELRGTEQPLLL